ncbi:unnamed protein product [Brassica oleracea var. botrytis]
MEIFILSSFDLCKILNSDSLASSRDSIHPHLFIILCFHCWSQV